MFKNPLLGMLAGLVLTAVIQSSSASVGILQSLCVTGAVSYGAAIPIIMGQNIGTCVTALLSSIGASRNARRTAFVHLYFNIIGSEWDTVIGNVTFTITMPKEFDSSKLGFSTGTKGSIENSKVEYNVDGNVITGS